MKRGLVIGSGVALLIAGSVGYLYPLFYGFDSLYWVPLYGYLVTLVLSMQLILRRKIALVSVGTLLLIAAESTNLYWLYSQHFPFDQSFKTSMALDLSVALGAALLFKSQNALRLLGVLLFLAGNLSWVAIFSQLGDILEPQLSYVAIAIGTGFIVNGLLKNKSSPAGAKSKNMEVKTRDDSLKHSSSLLGTTIASLMFGIITLILIGLLFATPSPFTLTDFVFLVPGSALITIILGLIALLKALRKQSRGDTGLSLASLLMGLIPIPVYIVIINLFMAGCSHGC